ncbi:conserved hypothetical protein [Ricinus communis]|uniref:Uncharacterized protein n=1 Tax=Ricinus communis TaxID=3988 RepID=B9SNY6_RICCO|nr:conserved hypothetical protein [Ricinus communis]
MGSPLNQMPVSVVMSKRVIVISSNGCQRHYVIPKLEHRKHPPQNDGSLSPPHGPSLE